MFFNHHFWDLTHVSWDLKTIRAFFAALQAISHTNKLLSLNSSICLPWNIGMMYVYKCSINPRQYLKFKKSHTEQSCANKIIQLNKMHSTKHTTKFDIYEPRHIFDFQFHLFIKKPPHLLSWSAGIHMHT